MANYFAGETIVDYIAHFTNTGSPITGATFTVVTARKPDGTSFTPTVTEVGGGSYRVTFATGRAEHGTWYLLLKDASNNRYYDSLFDLDPVTASTGGTASGTTTRATLRRWIGRLTGDVIVATATASGAANGTTVVDTVNLVIENGSLVNRRLLCTASNASGNIGFLTRVTANTKSTGTVTVSPVFPAQTTAGDVVEIWNDYGPTPDEVNDAINRAIAAAADSTVAPALSSVSTFAMDSPSLAIPSNWTFWAGVEWKDEDGLWRPVPSADLRLDPVARTVEIRNRAKWLADKKQVRMRGYTPPGPLNQDADATTVDAEWVVHQAAAWTLMSTADKRLSPGEVLAKAQYLEGRADSVRPKTRVRPQGKFTRLP